MSDFFGGVGRASEVYDGNASPRAGKGGSFNGSPADEAIQAMGSELEAATQALKERRSATNHTRMAAILSKQSKAFHTELDDALYHAGQAIDADPRYVPALRLRASLRAEKGEISGAIGDLDKVDELDAMTADDLMNRAKLCQQAGLVDRACEDLGRIISIDPENFDALGLLQTLRRQHG